MPLLKHKKYHLRAILGYLNKTMTYMSKLYENNELLLNEAKDFHKYLLSILAKHKYKNVQYLILYMFIRNAYTRYRRNAGTEISLVAAKNYITYIDYFIYVEKEA